MDSLVYFYLNNADPLYPSQQSNRLNYVKDPAGYAGLGDLPNQTTSNYSYTSNGNLRADASENLSFTWTPSNKLERVNKTSGGNTHTFRYSYDALGNRLSKRITYSTGSLPDNDTTWYYVRDAQGNPLATYIQYGSLLNSTPTYLMYLKEQMLYGSDRLGVQSQHKIVYKPLGGLPSLTDTIRQFLGATAYELTNHLGNVLATVSDRHLGRAAAPGAVNHYLADILTQTDFYPFGMGMPGRTYAAGQYRYGFNGKENDNEVHGLGNQQDYGMRIYDNRVGRFLSVDPLSFKIPASSTYSYCLNNPIFFEDPTGEFPIPASFKKNYPLLTNFIEHKLQKYLTSSERISDVLLRYSTGNLTNQQIVSDFRPKYGPKIVDHEFGKYDGTITQDGEYDYANNTIKLSVDALGRFEKLLASDKTEIRQYAMMEFTELFVNEYVHYGDALDGLDAIRDASGNIINNPDASAATEPAFPNIFEEGNEAANELYPELDGRRNYYRYKFGKIVSGDSKSVIVEDKTMIDGSMIPDEN